MMKQAAVRLPVTCSIAISLLFAAAGATCAGTISMAWDPLTNPNLVGYRVYYGTASGSYTQTLDVAQAQATLPNLNNCTTYFVSVKGRASDQTESSAFSNEIQGWARPEALSASPSSVQRASQLDLTINGANFMAGATVQFSDPAIVVNGVTVNGCTSLVVNISVPAGATLGSKGVTVINPDQVRGSGNALFDVTNAAPDSAIDQPAGPVTIAAGDTVQFAGSGSDPDGNSPLTYQWDLGDPSIPDSTQQNPGAVRYDTPGSYQASLTVRDALGLADATPASVTITVDQSQAPLITGISANPVGATTATVTWTTDKGSTSQVLFRPVGDTVYQQTSVDTSLVTSHAVDLQGLRPGASYEFQVRSADASGLTATEPAPGPFVTQTNSLTYIRIETESGPITPPAETVSDSGAFRGAYIRLASGTPGGNANNPSGTWDFGFHAPTAGPWHIWYRMYGQNNNSNGWFERVDGAGFQNIAPSQNGSWMWVPGRSYNLSSGLHVVTLGGNEALARIDRILVTDDPAFVPTESPGGDTTAPAPASGVAATPGDATVDLGWTNPSEAGSFRVVVRYATNGSQPLHPADGLPLADLAGVAGAAESLLHTGLVNGTTYRYSVFVVDGSDNASIPATAVAIPQPASTPLGTVQNLRRTDTVN